MHEFSCLARLSAGSMLHLGHLRVTHWVGHPSIPGEGDLWLLWFLWWVAGPRSRGCTRCWACEDSWICQCLGCLAFGRVGTVLTLIICCWHLLLWGAVGDLLLFCPGGGIVVIHRIASTLVCSIIGILSIYVACGCVPGSVGWLQHPASLIGTTSCRYKTTCVLRLLQCCEKHPFRLSA